MAVTKAKKIEQTAELAAELKGIERDCRHLQQTDCGAGF